MIIEEKMLNLLCLEAAAVPRRRKNLNFHKKDTSPCNRLLNAMEPLSYIQPHRHLDPEKDETVILLRGRMGVLYFSETGEVVMKTVLDPAAGAYGVNIAHGVIHTMVSLEPGTVFFESKSGPYVPILDAERVAWAPRENEAGVATYLESLRLFFEP